MNNRTPKRKLLFLNSCDRVPPRGLKKQRSEPAFSSQRPLYLTSGGTQDDIGTLALGYFDSEGSSGRDSTIATTSSDGGHSSDSSNLIIVETPHHHEDTSSSSLDTASSPSIDTAPSSSLDTDSSSPDALSSPPSDTTTTSSTSDTPQVIAIEDEFAGIDLAFHEAWASIEEEAQADFESSSDVITDDDFSSVLDDEFGTEIEPMVVDF